MTTRISPRELEPRSDADGTQFLRDDLTWAEPPAAPSGGGLPAGGGDGDILWYDETVTYDTIALVATSSALSSGYAASLSVPLPPGTQVGNLVLVVTGSWNGSFNTPAGWSNATGANSGGYSLWTFWKVATQSDLDAGAVTMQRSAGTEVIVAVAAAYAGAGGVHATAKTTTSSTSTLTFPAVTTTVPNCVIVALATSAYSSGTFTAAAPLSMRKQQQGGTNAMLADYVKPGTGVTPALTGTSAKQWLAATIALEPAVLSSSVEAFWAPPRDRGAFTTAGRPALGTNDGGVHGFDVTLGKPVWWTGTVWVDGNGATV